MAWPKVAPGGIAEADIDSGIYFAPLMPTVRYDTASCSRAGSQPEQSYYAYALSRMALWGACNGFGYANANVVALRGALEGCIYSKETKPCVMK
jgi:hypothetical protein